MYTRPTAPQSIGAVLDSTFKLWLPVLRKTWILVLIPQLLSAGLSVYQVIQNPNIAAGSPAFNLGLAAGSQSAAINFLALLVGIVSIGFYNAMWVLGNEAAVGGTMSLGEGIASGFRRWLALFGLGVLAALVLIPFGIAMLSVINIPAATADGPASMFKDASPAAVLEALLFALAYLIVLLWLFGRLFLAPLLIVLEQLGPFKALGRSWVLTRGNWGRCAAILTVVSLLAYLFLLLIGVVSAALTFRNLRAGTQLLTPGTVVTQEIFSIVYAVIYTPLFIASNLSIYFDLKLRKEGGDLAGRIEALGPESK